MNSLERYQNELIVMALLVGQQDEIINDIKEQKKLQEFYISSEILETLKKIIMENNEKCFIDFRVKNKIIDIIEQNEGIDSYNDTKEGSVIGDINSYLNTVSYYVNLANIKNNNTENINCYDRGYCIEETTAPVTDGITSKYYKVTTYININFPFFKLNFNIPITGETRKIERINR